MTLLDQYLSVFVAGSPYKAGELLLAKPIGSTFTVSRASTATRVNSAGLIESVANDVPRLDYSGGVSCPALLVENTATNLTTYSNSLLDASWIVSESSVASGVGTSAFQGLLSFKLIENTANAIHFLAKVTSLGGSVDSSMYSVSIFAKADGRSRFQMFDNNQLTSGITIFDLSNGTIISGTGTIVNYGNGWYRCSIYPLKDNSTTSSVVLRLINTGTNTTYLGDGVSGIELNQYDVTAGTSTSSPIFTTAAAATRLADVISKTDEAGAALNVTTFEDGSTFEDAASGTFTLPVGRIINAQQL